MAPRCPQDGPRWPQIAHVLKEKPKRNQSIVGVRSVLLCAASSSSGLLLAPLSAPLGTIPGRSWRHLGQVLDLSWTILGLSWPNLGLSLAILGLSWAILALSWTCLGLFWACLGPSWAYLGRSWPCLGPVWSHLGALVGHPGAILSPLGPKPENDPQKYEKRVPGLNDFGDHFGAILGSFSGPFFPTLQVGVVRFLAKSGPLLLPAILDRRRKRQ